MTFHVLDSALIRDVIQPLWRRFRGSPRGNAGQALGHVGDQLEFYQQVLDQSAIFAITDVRGTITYVNDQFCEISGYNRAELIGQNHRILNSDYHPHTFFRQMYKTLVSTKVWRGEICNRNKAGELYWVDTTIVPVTDERGRIETYLAIRFDVTQRKVVEHQLKHLAEHDPLTGLANRSVMTHEIVEAWAASQSDGEPFALFFLDYDRFKYINDSMGHHVGDQLLCAIADYLRQWIDGRGIAARMGGDEFAILLRNVSTEDHVLNLAADLGDRFSYPMIVGDKELTSTASLGVIHSDYPVNDADELMHHADLAMYEAKRCGRGRACLFDESLHEKETRRIEVESALRPGQWDDQFHLVYQPIMNLRTGKTYGFEALARWVHPTLGPVSPDEFIPILEDIRMIVPFGEWVLRTACDQLVQWDRQGVSEDHLHMNVNLAKLQINDPDLLNKVRQILQKTGLSADRLTLEITESNIVDRADSIEKVLQEIRQLGIYIAMDDFGTGTSSLSLLHELSIDILKIDRSFVWRLEQCRELMAVIQSIAELARNLNMRVVAEGIETAEHVAVLQALDCDYGQGYYFAKPLEVLDVLAFLDAPVKDLRLSA